MKRILIALLAVTIGLMGCTGNKATTGTDEVAADSTETADTIAADSLEEELTAEDMMPRGADELFDDFIFNFAANRKLQLRRIQFPLPVSSDGQQSQRRKQEWKMEHFFMQQGYYTLLFDNEQQMELVKDTSVHHAVVERIMLDTKRVKQYVFDRIRGLWMLTAVEEQPLEDNHNASFLNFYQRFASDSVFQAASLNSTVQFVGPDPDDDFAQMEGIITPDTWAAFAPELPSPMIYNIVYGEPKASEHQKIFVLRGIANGLEVQMTFRQSAGRWRLAKLTE